MLRHAVRQHIGIPRFHHRRIGSVQNGIRLGQTGARPGIHGIRPTLPALHHQPPETAAELAPDSRPPPAKRRHGLLVTHAVANRRTIDRRQSNGTGRLLLAASHVSQRKKRTIPKPWNPCCNMSPSWTPPPPRGCAYAKTATGDTTNRCRHKYGT